MAIQITVNPLTSLENILEKINAATNGQVELSVVRKNLVKSEVSVSVHPNTVVEYVPKPIIKEVVKEVKIYAKKPSATSKFHCVYFDKAKEKWSYKFVHKKQNYYGRGFKTELEAAKAYNNHVVKIKGSDAILNDVG